MVVLNEEYWLADEPTAFNHLRAEFGAENVNIKTQAVNDKPLDEQ